MHTEFQKWWDISTMILAGIMAVAFVIAARKMIRESYAELIKSNKRKEEEKIQREKDKEELEYLRKKVKEK